MSEPRSPDEVGELFHANLAQQQELRMALRQLEIENANLMVEVRPQLSHRAWGHWMSSNSKGYKLSQPKTYKHRRIAECFGYDWHGMADDMLFFLTLVDENIRHKVVEMYRDAPKPTKKQVNRAVEDLTSGADQEIRSSITKHTTPARDEATITSTSAGERAVTAIATTDQATLYPPSNDATPHYRKSTLSRLLNEWFTASEVDKESFLFTIIEDEGPAYVGSKLNIYVNIDNPAWTYNVLCTKDGLFVGEKTIMLRKTQEYYGAH